MRLPDPDHVARTCKFSTLDPQTRAPTPASFEFRFDEDGGWKDTYLSVHWLEHLPPGDGDIPAKLQRLRTYLLEKAAAQQRVLKPTKQMAFAVLRVQSVHEANLMEVGTTLEARHEPHWDGDPHSGIYPTPGVEAWPMNGDAAAHLAVQQYLFQRMSNWERAIPE